MRISILIYLLCLLAFPSSANGPAWISEISDVDPAHTDSIEITIPIGSSVAVAIHNTDAVSPDAPACISTYVRVMWFEHRTVFVGLDEERDVSIPYYLPAIGDCTPTGSWVVEIEPSKIGTYVVPIKCNSNTVKATIHCMELEKSDIGYGFYTDSARYADWTKEHEYLKDMSKHGMNTFTPYAREIPPKFGVKMEGWEQSRYDLNLKFHIDTAIEAGLVDSRFPLICLSASPDILSGAMAAAENEWPELIGYNHDEPGLSMADSVRKSADEWHTAGFKTATSISGNIAIEIGAPLDIWILHMASITPNVIDACVRQRKAFWVYNCDMRGTNAALHRYWTGIYTWALQPQVCLTWAYMNEKESRIMPDGTWNMLRTYDSASADAAGSPIPTVGLKGMQEGIIDSRFLQALEKKNSAEGNSYLNSIREQVRMGFWKEGRGREYSTYSWDIPDTQIPEINPIIVRQNVLELLNR